MAPAAEPRAGRLRPGRLSRHRRLPAVRHEGGQLGQRRPGSLGIVIGGSGNGEQIAANKIHGVRAALAWSEETARLARRHNNANVLSLGARMHPTEVAVSFARIFIETEFSGEARHARRIDMISDYERTGELPAAP
jgi:ribose 5-phosphate isomerase B